MKKVITIEGMMCEHCAAAVESALKVVDTTESVKINLKKKTATLKTDAENDSLIKAVENAGYKVISIE